jgi:hypothetical protein
MPRSLRLALLGLLAAGCTAKPAEPPAPAPAAPAPAPAATNGKKDWVPSEFKDTWRDPVAYVDGTPVGVLVPDELPRPLALTASGDELRFTVAAYLEAIGLPASRLKAVHVYADPTHVRALDVHGLAGAELRAPRQGGKPVLDTDRVAALCVYVKKKPPELRPDGTVWLAGQAVGKSIPYFGPPRRGGVRVYLDGRLAAWIKRNRLPEEALIPDSDEAGDPRWSLFDFLAGERVPVSRIQSAETAGGAPTPLDRAALASASFSMVPQQRGEIRLHVGERTLAISTLHLFSKPTGKKLSAQSKPLSAVRSPL